MFSRNLLEKVCEEMNEVMGLTEVLDCAMQDDDTLLETIIWEARGRGILKDAIRADDFVSKDKNKQVFSKDVAKFLVDAGVWDSEAMKVIMEDSPAMEQPSEEPTVAEEQAAEQSANDEMEAGESVDETPVPRRVKAKKEKAPKSIKDIKKPGVIATIVDLVCNHGPITKEKIVATLIKKFPDRDAKGMSKTVNVQIPGRIQKEHGIKLVKIENKGWKKK